MYPTDRSISAPSAFSPALPPLTSFDVMASTPVSSAPSSATDVAEVLAAHPNDELAAELGSWPVDLQAKVAAAMSAMGTTASSTSGHNNGGGFGVCRRGSVGDPAAVVVDVSGNIGPDSGAVQRHHLGAYNLP